jgi:4-hydroxy-3-methylbut-2-en-1-yl diphosphate reductase
MIQNIRSISVPNIERYGFCEGVVAADSILTRVASTARALGINTIYGYHDVVHNKTVTAIHEQNGVVFVDDPFHIPPHSVVVLSAHGSSPVVPWVIENMGGVVFDSVCPLVGHIHKAVREARKNNEKLLYIVDELPVGQKVHDEVLGTLGNADYRISGYRAIEYSPVPRQLFSIHDEIKLDPSVLEGDHTGYRIVAQTTLIASESLRFKEQLEQAIMALQPQAIVSRVDRRDTCFAAENRQEGVRIELSKKPDSIIVVTDQASKNGMSYVQLAKEIVSDEDLDTQVYTVETHNDLLRIKHQIVGSVALTASASTPDSEVEAIIKDLSPGTTFEMPIRPGFRLNGSTDKEIAAKLSIWLRGF